MDYALIENYTVIKIGLPATGTLKDGRTVSGYHLLDEEILLSEGWLPLEDIKPEYDETTQYLIHDGYEILEDRVIVKYRFEEIPVEEPHEPEPSETELLQQENEKLKSQLFMLEQTTSETSATQQELIELLIEMGVI